MVAAERVYGTGSDWIGFEIMATITCESSFFHVWIGWRVGGGWVCVYVCVCCFFLEVARVSCDLSIFSTCFTTYLSKSIPLFVVLSACSSSSETD